MNVEDIQSICRQLPAVKEDIKWEHDLVFSIGDKMFCVIGLDQSPTTASFKVTEEEFDEMCNRPGFKPAPYVAKYKWVWIENIDKMKRSDWKKYIEQSYELVKNKLSAKKERNWCGIVVVFSLVAFSTEFMTIQEAEIKAESFAKSFGEIFPGIYHSIRNPQEFIDCFYFDLTLADRNDQIPKKRVSAGGARGVTVNKLTAECDTISFGNFSKMKAKEEEVYSTIAAIKDPKENAKTLVKIKAKFKFSSRELLELKNLIVTQDIFKDNISAITKLLSKKK